MFLYYTFGVVPSTSSGCGRLTDLEVDSACVNPIVTVIIIAATLIQVPFETYTFVQL